MTDRLRDLQSVRFCGMMVMMYRDRLEVLPSTLLLMVRCRGCYLYVIDVDGDAPAPSTKGKDEVRGDSTASVHT